MDCVVAHPRSGTSFAAQLLAPHAAHEFLAQLSPLGVSLPTGYYQGTAGRDQVLRLLDLYPAGAVRIDSNWKLAWILEPFLERFPDARVLHLVRDPRQVIRSAYDLDYYGSLREHPGFARDHARNHWLSHMPRIRRPDWDGLSQLERNCAFWAESQRLLRQGLARHPRVLRVRLEDLTGDVKVARAVLDFFGVEAPPRLEELLPARVNQRSDVKARVAAHRPPLGPFAEWRQPFLDLCGEEAALAGYPLSGV